MAFLHSLLLAFVPALFAAAPVEFAPAREAFVARFAAFRPEAGTGLGLPGFNDKLGLPSPANIAGQIAFFEGVERHLASLPVLKPQDEIDRKAMLTIARSQLHELRDRKSYLTDAGAGQGPYDIVQLQVSQLGAGQNAAQEWADIAARAEQVPAYLRAVQDNLRAGAAEGRQAYRGFIEKDGIAAARDAAEFFASELLSKAKARLPAADLARLEAAGAAARAAYLAHADFLAAEILPHATEIFALGEQEYSWKLAHELGVTESPALLQEKGRALAAKITARMEELARKIAPDKTLPELMAELRSQHPKDDAELRKAYDETSRRARDFVVAEKLFAIPADYSISLMETPAGMRSHVGSAAYFPAPALDPSKKGVFLLTPSGGDAKRLAIHNFSKIPTTVVHEAFPGHDMQFWTFQRANIPAVRHLLDWAGSAAALNVEGYAHYAEELMRRRGFFTPKEELAQLGAQLWRAWRVTLDAGLHLGQFSMAQVAQTLTEKAFLPQPIAEVEAYRYARMPTQALTYALGRLQIEELKEAYQKKAGSAYSEAAFHQAFLSFGPVLPSLIAPALLEAAREPSWLKRLWRSAGARIALSVLAAGVFNLGLWAYAGTQAAQEFLSAYLIEWTLSLDNLVVLSTVIHALPEAIRPRVLTWGIAGTILLRLVMVTAGVGLTAANPGIFIVFGAFLLSVGVKMFNPKWDLIGWLLGQAGEGLKGLGISPKRPRWLANPFLWGLLCVIGYDVVFALDSVPAALAISKSVFVIIAANTFSVLGLRSLFSVLDKLEEKFRHLSKGVGVVLLFVAAKMILEPLAHVHIAALPSLLAVLGILGAAMLLSLRPKRG